MTNRKNIEDMYPLSPMQQGMLFHTLYAPESGVYFEQLSCSFEGNFQIQPFQQAWQQVVARHQVLRTAFIWSGQSQPLQVVYRQVQLPLEIHDWRGVSRDNQHQQLSAFLQSDRERGFQLSQAPLMRLTLIQMDEDVYQFVLSHHHLLMDGWSLHLVFKEVLACYEACIQGQELHLEPTGRYRDYIAWLQKQNQAKAEGFWRQVLQGFTAPTPLIVDRAPTSLSGEQAQHSKQQIWLSAGATAALQSFVRQHQLTLNTLVQAAWALLLSRYSGEADVVFGVTVSGRSAAIRGVESVVGLLINTLPMRVLVRGDDSTLSWLKQIQNQQVEMSQYEYSPLVQIQRMSEVPQGVPLFESIVVFENYPVDAALHERFHLQVRDVHAFDQTNYPLTLVAVPSTQLSLQLGYDTHRFDAATTARMLGHLQTLLEEIVAHPYQRLSDIPILSATEQQQLLVEWNDTKADYPQNVCIHQLFEAQVERTPDAVAVVFDMQQLTYQELNSRANRIAHHLQALGVQPEVLVGICMERSLEMIVGLLGILKAGGAYVPLDPAYPAERLAFMLENTQAPILLTQHSLVASLPEHETRVICLDSDWEIIAQQSAENLSGAVTPANLAYVIYTSGSTGQPKGVTIPHRSIVNRVFWGLVRYQLTPADRVLQKTSFSFDVSLWEFFGPLLAGARLVMAQLGGHQDPTYLVQVMAERQITIVDFVPAMLQLLLEQPGLEACTALRYVTCGSEALPTEVRDRFFARLGAVELHNCYGPTEVSIDATYWVCDRHSPITPIGRPIANQEVYILDAHLHPVPVGVPGELYVGGAGLARGYQNRPDWAAEKFIPHPFSNEPGARLYKTGDLASYLLDGNVEFLGRLDDQVKIRGFRIELGEIEAVLRRHPDVEETIVLVRDDAAADGHHQGLVAYLVPKQRNEQIEFWPSVGEYPLYDEFLYHVMTSDSARNQRYQSAIDELVRDKVVVEVGTGQDAILARFCVAAGAKKVYAIEVSDEAYHRAVALVKRLGLEDKIILIHGYSTKVELSENVDVCVSEIIGTIGGSEGVAAILNDARRFLKEDACMIPHRCITKIAAVSLPDELRENLRFNEVPGNYVRQIFEHVGRPFDLRLCIKNFPQANLISNSDVFEDLTFTDYVVTEYNRTITLTITKPSRLDGFLLWLNLYTAPSFVIDNLEQDSNWLPVYFPVFYPGMEVSPGDTIKATCISRLSDNNINPDYRIEGQLIRQNGEIIPFAYDSLHHQQATSRSPFYELLLPQGEINLNNGHHQLSAKSIRAYLSGNLPDYMLPATFVMLDTLPRTANGKVDRSRLIATELRPEVGITFVAPRTPIQQILAGIWSEVLGVGQVGVSDNFFELGGHSLLATQLISRVRATLAVELPLRSLFEHPTVSGLAECIETALRLGPSMAASPILPMAREIEIPLSFAQQRLWFLDQLEPGNAFYNIPAAVRLTGQLNVAALEQSFNHIISRHEALRTNFATLDGQPVQVIAAILTLTLPVVNLQELPETSREIATQQLAKQEAVRPFNLASEPLVRAKLLQRSSAEHVLLLTMHHIIADGWSTSVLVRELAAVYEALCNHLPPKLPELPIQYADFAMWQRQWLQGEVLEAQLAYWKQQLGANLPVLQLPTTRPRAEVKTRRGATNSFLIPSNLSEALQTLSRQEGVTLFMTLLASFYVLLQRYTNQDDIVVGTDVANRNWSETEVLIGFFVNLLVLRTDLSGNPSFRELLLRVREVALGAYAHQDLPFEKLVEALRPERNSSNTASLFQVLFVLQNAPMPALELPGLTLSLLEVETEIAKFDLALFLTETEQGIVVNLQYNADLFEPNTIARLSAHFETLLKSIVAQPDARINNLEMLTETEKEQQTVKTRQHKASKLKKFMAVQPKAMELSREKLFETDFLQLGETSPLVITPNIDDVDISEWTKNNREFIETKLLHYGAILFRNFNVADSTEFQTFAEAICPDLFGDYGDLPREGVSGKVYGSTSYPSDEAILFHNESSHMHCWPQKIWFFCVQPAQQRGETPIVDTRKVLQLLDPKLREKFASKQLMYVRNYIESLDVSWQDFFHTTDKAEVEEYCRKASISVEWKLDGGLRTCQVRPAVVKHPKTGEASFFNQIQLHHPYCLKSEVRESLLSSFGENNLPRNVYYGDGSPIEDSVIEEILAVYQEAEVSFPWQKGDVMMLDNMLTAHGRNPYVGPRKIMVAMGQMIHSTDIEHKGIEKVYAN